MEKHKVIGTVVGVLAFIALIAGLTYAWYTWQSADNTNISFTVGGVDITFEAGSDITSSKLRPVSAKGIGAEEGYSIEKTITASSPITAYLNLYLTLETLPEGLKDESFKWELYKGEELINSGNFKEETQGNKLTIAENQQITSETVTYELYIWIDGTMPNPSTMQNQTFKFLLSADATDQIPVTQSPSLATLTKLGLSANEGTPDFNQVATTDEGIFAAEDDLGTSYYFRGAVENNYVKFAGYYWRIIRINGDGTIRIIYDGTSAHANGEASADRQVSTIAFNTNYGDSTYVGYMYGTPGSSTYEDTHANTTSSTIKIVNDNWYEANVVDKNYSQYVADAIFCDDRSLSSGTGIGTTETYYMSHNRLNTNKTPSLKCIRNTDKFTTSSSLGNGDLTYPVGLITGDEVAFAGGMYSTPNSLYYLYSGQRYWTITPYDSFLGSSRVWANSHLGYLSMTSVGTSDNYGLRPVISLKSDITFSGNGSMNQPFEIIS